LASQTSTVATYYWTEATAENDPSGQRGKNTLLACVQTKTESWA